MTSTRPTINLVSSTRADYGLLRWLIESLKNEGLFDVQVTVTGTHLLSEFGETWREIERDGISIDFRVPISLTDDSFLGMANAVASTVNAFAQLFVQHTPDLVLVLGDRYEIMAVAEAAFLSRIPIAHLHGGEITNGALDDTMRHVITKFASLHFVATYEYRRRVIQLGEYPDNVHVVGAMSLDSFAKLESLDIQDLSEIVGAELDEGFALVTMHPETVLETDIEAFLQPLLHSLQEFPNLQVVFTRANADPGGREVNRLLEEYVQRNGERMVLVSNLGNVGYVNALRLSGVVIGNSSSGIVEAPSAGTPTVNIGGRQDGRLRAPSVIDTVNSKSDIVAAIERALTPKFAEFSARKLSPFGEPGAASRITAILRETDFSGLLPKRFNDVGFVEGVIKGA